MTQSGNIVKPGFMRTIFRWIHIVFAIPILGFIYSPFDKIPSYAPATRFVFVPIIVLSGLWMWKGHVVSTTDFEKTCQWYRCIRQPVIQRAGRRGSFGDHFEFPGARVLCARNCGFGEKNGFVELTYSASAA